MNKSDFFGDHNNDIVFQNSDGAIALWDMSGASILGAGVVAVNPGPTWAVEDTAGGLAVTPGSGSFTDAAGNVFTIAAGNVAAVNGSPISLGGGTAKLEYYNGIVFGQDATTGAWYTLDADGSWSRSAAPGLFGDGNSAIVLQNNDGSVALWDMSGTNILAAGVVPVNPGPSWHVKGTGLFFGGGSTAIVFQNDDGSVALWNMSGTNILGAGVVAVNPGPSWHIEGTGSFFGYASSALVLQNNDGAVALWDIGGGTDILGAGAVAVNPGPAWQIKGTGNFFGDGNTDLVFQNSDGAVALWDMSGANILGAGVVAVNPGPTWHIKGTGATDIVFQNDNGSVAVWQMSGLNVIGGGVVAVNPGTAWNALDDNMRFIYSTSANETLAATPEAPDEFVFTNAAAGPHTIDGFNPLQDMIELSKAQFASFSEVQAATSAISGGAMINLGNGGSLLLPGVDTASLHASNFALA
jgi:WD40 repeat protein